MFSYLIDPIMFQLNFEKSLKEQKPDDFESMVKALRTSD